MCRAWRARVAQQACRLRAQLHINAPIPHTSEWSLNLEVVIIARQHGRGCGPHLRSVNHVDLLMSCAAGAFLEHQAMLNATVSLTAAAQEDVMLTSSGPGVVSSTTSSCSFIRIMLSMVCV